MLKIGSFWRHVLGGMPNFRRPDEIADNITNKCTLINTKSDCYELWGTFQQLTKVNSKRWTSDMQNALKYDYSTGKLHDVLSMCPCTSQFCNQHIAKVPQWLLHKFSDLSLTLCLFPDLCAILSHFQLSRKVVTPTKRNARTHVQVWHAYT